MMFVPSCTQTGEHAQPRRGARRWPALALLALGLSGNALCGCTESIKPPGQRKGDNVMVNEPDASLATCENLANGTECGEDLHCIDETCVPNTCGDGVVAGNEECDDGNESIGDDCNPACRHTPITCGNARTEEGEECDDGNQRDGDGCSNGCTLSRCGNARRDPGEECDDGNEVQDDYCSNTCTRNACRNGRVDPGEQCDDGNAVTTDGCTNDCQLLRCGDGITNTDPGPLLEECDDGNLNDSDACSNQCTRNVCGNMRKDPGEVCDGNINPENTSQKCKADCKGWDEDACFQCMVQKCSLYQEVLPLYDACHVKATPQNYPPYDGSGLPYESFTQDCSAFDRCVRTSGCARGASDKGTAPCFCGQLSDIECAMVQGLPKGPCVMESIKATRCASAEKVVDCVNAKLQDLTEAAGVTYFLAECRDTNCLDLCGGS